MNNYTTVTALSKRGRDVSQIEAGNALVLRYQRYFYKYAMRACSSYSLPTCAFDDVRACLQEAALNAAPEYDSRIASFPTYLRWHLRKAVYVYLATCHYTFRFPTRQCLKLRRISAIAFKHELVTGVSLSVPALAELAGVTSDEVVNVSLLSQAVSFDQSAFVRTDDSSAGDLVLSDVICDENQVPAEDVVCRTDASMVLLRALATLSSREQLVIRLTILGVHGEVYDHRHIATHLKCSHQNVSLIKLAALKKLHGYMRRHRLHFTDLVAG